MGWFLRASLFMLLAGSAWADTSVKGSWLGRIVDDGLPVVVRLEVNALKLGEESLRIEYASPRNCFAVGEYAGDMDGREIFYITDSSARTYCDRYTYNIDSIIRLKIVEDGGLKYDIHNVGRYKKHLETGTLYRP